MTKWNIPDGLFAPLSDVGAPPRAGLTPPEEVGAGLKRRELLTCIDSEIDASAQRIAALKKRRLEVQDDIRSYETGFEDGA
ncbi:MAG: hypothetical protein ABJN42_10565 [Roseibium sp.]|uniref:hypothetical protein n=1 Tax=Roseibium sp. TaxID=1936156 RepID=UPI003297E6BC